VGAGEPQMLAQRIEQDGPDVGPQAVFGALIVSVRSQVSGPTSGSARIGLCGDNPAPLAVWTRLR